MENMYNTGNEIVDENAKVCITGNVIPQIWYRTIVRDTGKPYLAAIIILADIVYWYKPTEVRDENTGQVIAVKKKFKADLLQRSYQQISEEFGISKKEATNAVIFLEKLGVIKRAFRKVNINGLVVNNVLYLELVVDKLKALTYQGNTNSPPVSLKRDRVGTKSQIVPEKPARNGDTDTAEGTPVTLKRDRVPLKKGTGISNKKDGTDLLERGRPHLKGETNTENTAETLPGDYLNPIQSYQTAKTLFKEQIGYDAIFHDRPYDRDRLDEIVAIAVDVLTSTTKSIRVNSENRPAEVVKSVYWRLDQFAVEMVLDALRNCEKKVHNVRAVILTALYNATMTTGTYYTNLMTHNQSVP